MGEEAYVAFLEFTRDMRIRNGAVYPTFSQSMSKNPCIYYLICNINSLSTYISYGKISCYLASKWYNQ